MRPFRAMFANPKTMQLSAGKVAVITGAASGIGRALAAACCDRGMTVLLVDLPGDRLDEAAAWLASRGRVMAHGIDVANENAVAKFGRDVHDRVGTVHLLCNNAGIAGVHKWCWNFSAAEWARMIDVNLRGAVNVLQAFLPLMVDQAEGHIVNTSSMAGLIPTRMNAPYAATKFGIVGMSEAVALDLKEYGSAIGISVLCPGLVSSNIAGDRDEVTLSALHPLERTFNREVADAVAGGMDPANAADIVLNAVETDCFYILTHPEAMPLVERRMDAIRSKGRPTPPR